MQQHRALILRGNRFLGSSLVDKGLLTMNDLESANEKFMGAIQQGDMKHASILTSLIYDLKVLDENKLIDYIVEEYELGLIDLSFIELKSLRPMEVNIDLCWATSTVPFDKIEDTYMMATCYYMSAPVIKYWEEALDGKVIWYATSCQSFTRALEKITDIHDAEDAAEEDED
ncbi:MAG TPA: hypothetical protein DCX06_02380 [Opitutae bacterium]|nr:hypothetical protein [Opitutae bacterium]